MFLKLIYAMAAIKHEETEPPSNLIVHGKTGSKGRERDRERERERERELTPSYITGDRL
jgi:hypothetical protein